MNQRVRIERAAEEELRGAIVRYEEKRTGLGAEFYREVQRVLQIIKRHPGIGTHRAQSSITNKYAASIVAPLSIRGRLS